MIPLTEEQRLAAESAAETPIRLTDPRSHQEYVLLRAEVYDRLRRVLAAEEVDPSLYEFEGQPQS